jgi:hypothetical protein
MNTNLKRIVICLVVVATSGVALAQTTSKTPKARTPKARTSTSRTRVSRTDSKYVMYKYIRMYKGTDEQKAKLEKVLLAQKKDLADHDKVYTPKTKAVDDKIAALQKEIDALKAGKSEYTDKRAELLLDHKAEINNVFSVEQRTKGLAEYLRSTAFYRYWDGLSEAQKKEMNAKCQAAALKVVMAKPEEVEGVLATQRRELQKVASDALTPEIRQAGEAQYATQSTIRAFYRIKLSDDQKAQIRAMCDKAAKEKGDLYAKYRQLDKDRDAIRKSMYKLGSSDYYRKLRAEVTEKVLTEEQRKAGSSRSSKRSSSTRTGRTSSRKSGAKPVKGSVDKTPK